MNMILFLIEVHILINLCTINPFLRISKAKIHFQLQMHFIIYSETIKKISNTKNNNKITTKIWPQRKLTQPVQITSKNLNNLLILIRPIFLLLFPLY